jgi:PAS domain S-box-containing protein
MLSQHQQAGGTKSPLPLETWLQIAISAADALAKLHQSGVIHQNIRPETLRIDPRGEGVLLTGAGLSQQSEQPVLRLPLDALPYIAPEQTGRLEGMIDHRADLYSLAIVLYELRAGVLPFQAEDPLGWVHCHVARAPRPLAEAAPGTPAIVSEIIMKLLAKSPDERYQSALGLTHDLQRSLSELSSRGSIDPFPLGTRDVWDKLRVASRLYGRSEEVAALRDAAGRVRVTGGREVVLVAGASGIGKSALVRELQRELRGQHAAAFLFGKFEQSKRDIPYAVLAQAFQDLIRQTIASTDAELASVRQRILRALGDNGQLIIDLIPQIELVIGKQPPALPLPAAEAQSRFHLVFRKFLSVFATPERPLILFLDDLQWADFASLELVQHIAVHPDIRNLLVIGAYRDDEVDSSHPLEATLREIRDAGTPVTLLALDPLGQADLDELVMDLFHCDRHTAKPLAALLWAKTNGHPFFGAQLLGTLHKEQLIRFDVKKWAWHWDIAEIEAEEITDDMVELVLGRLRSLPAGTIEVLRLAACIGNEFSLDLLGTLSHKTIEQVRAALEPALMEGLLLQRSQSYKFLHDRVLQAAYSLIPEEERPGLHLRLGFLLLEHTPGAAIDGLLFNIVNQLNLGAGRVEEASLRRRIAELDLRAGRKAKAASAMKSAVGYLGAGISLLPSGSWETDHALAYGLHLELAECEYVGGRFREAEELCSLLLAHSRSNVERAAVVVLQIQLATAQVDNARAVELARDCLRTFGVDLPREVTTADLMNEITSLRDELRGRPVEQLIDMPVMTDPEMRAATEILAVIHSAGSFTAPNLPDLASLRVVRLSIGHGNTPATAYGYANLAHILCARLGEFRDGYHFGSAGWQLAQRPEFGNYTTEAAFFACQVLPWSRHIREALDLHRMGFESGQRAGKVLNAAFHLYHIVMALLAMGAPLDAVHEANSRALEFATAAKLAFLIDNAVLYQRLVESLKGNTEFFGALNGDGFDEVAFDAHLNERNVPAVRFFVQVYKLSLRYTAGDYAGAQVAAKAAEGLLLWGGFYGVAEAERRFYAALTALALYEEASEEDRASLGDQFSAHEAQLRIWAESCPDNFACRHALVAAEIARIQGRNEEAAALYNRAIRASRDGGFVQIEGLACELASSFYMRRDFAVLPAAFLREARMCYARWGALGKVRQLETRYPDLLAKPLEQSAPAQNADADAAQIDTLTATKASAAISSQMAPEALLATLMRILTEHAGAQRACLLVPSQHGLNVVAEITTDHEGVRVDVPKTRRAPSAMEFPLSIAQYVRRTREKLVLDDSAAAGMFSVDGYLSATQPRSILCAPIVRHGDVAGILYLENKLTRGAFTPRRLTLLEFLAAISLENALLADDLARETLERTQAEKTLRQSEKRLQRLVETANVVPWEADRGTGHFTYVGPQVVRMLGYPQEAWFSAGFMDEHVHPDDRQSTKRQFASPSPDNDFDFRMIAADGRTVWLHNVVSTYGLDGSDLLGGFLFDVTERKQAEAILQEKLDIIEEQQVAIRTLSTPIIQVWEGVLTVPVLGVLDEQRVEQMMSVVLDAVATSGAEYAIIDLTGVDIIDTRTADHIMKIVRAIQLLGARAIVVGIRSEVAQAIVGLGVDLSAITTLANLRDALLRCMRDQQNGRQRVRPSRDKPPSPVDHPAARRKA